MIWTTEVFSSKTMPKRSNSSFIFLFFLFFFVFFYSKCTQESVFFLWKTKSTALQSHIHEHATVTNCSRQQSLVTQPALLQATEPAFQVDLRTAGSHRYL